MNPMIPALAGLLTLGGPALPESPLAAGCRGVPSMPDGLPELVYILDNAVWEAPVGTPEPDALSALDLGRVDLKCWDPDTGRFGKGIEGLPIVRMFSGTPLEALECGIDESILPADTPAWKKCDKADELASTAVRALWDAAHGAAAAGRVSRQ